MKRRRDGVSDRAARTGAGGWDLSEATGSLDVDYETLGVLGRGSFAEINLVRHRATGALCALKFCCKLDAPSFGHLRAEATLASRLRHPFILSPSAISDSPGRAGNYSVLLPLCPGGDLLQLLRRRPSKALDEPTARAYATMIVLGLRAIHDAGLAYRDLKPENLLLQANGYLWSARATRAHDGTFGTCAMPPVTGSARPMPLLLPVPRLYAPAAPAARSLAHPLSARCALSQPGRLWLRCHEGRVQAEGRPRGHGTLPGARAAA